MARSRHPRSKASTEAMRRFKAMLPALLSEVAVHGVAHVKLIREYRDDGTTTVIVVDDTSNCLPNRGRSPDPNQIDYRMLKEARSL